MAISREAKAQTSLLDASLIFLDWMKYENDIKDTTLEGYVYLLGRLHRDLGDRRMGSLTEEHIKKWFFGPGGVTRPHRVGEKRYQRLGPAIANSTYMAYRAKLRMFFEWAHKNGYTKTNLMANVGRRKVVDRHRQRPVPETLVGLLDSAKNPRDRIYIAVALNTALRESEIVPLRKRDVDLENGWLYATIYKTGDIDEMPISEDFERELQRWFMTYPVLIGRDLQPDDYLIPATSGNLYGPMIELPDGTKVQTRAEGAYHPHRKVTRAMDIVKHALGKAGLETRYEGTHTIRRAVARAYYDSLMAELLDRSNVGTAAAHSLAIGKVMALLHHKQQATTERYIGADYHRAGRDLDIKGKPFLTGMYDSKVTEADVVPIRPAVGGD